ncbi:MAG: hypothetical protein CME01_03035, partial [Geminicoccus sp.]|nr:hypothetical protein [Geminicoccus sp.]
MPDLARRLIISSFLVLVLGSIAACLAFFVYAVFFYLVIIDGYELHSVFQKFHTTALAALLLIPIELSMHIVYRRSMVQYGWVLLLVAMVVDTVVSTILFYRADSLFFAYIASVTEMERYSLVVLANEMLASILSILAALLFLVLCQAIPIRLNLVDPRADNASNYLK